MQADSRIVVKVGGSLYDWPELPARLRAFVKDLEARSVILVPGGGAAADAIRQFDRVHRLEAETAHWLAIRAMSLNARVLTALLPETDLVASAGSKLAPGMHVLDAYPFFVEDNSRPDPLPHGWDVTSDSLAVRAAIALDAREVILLKSTTWSGNDWQAAIAAGVVDAYFAQAIRQAHGGLRVRCVNLRETAV